MRSSDNPATIPATGAWHPASGTGSRHFIDLGSVPLESGDSLPVVLAYETFGTLNADRSNAVLVLHALTGDSHVTRHTPDDTAGWWEDTIGPGKAIDTHRYFVVAPNILGGCQGSTGPASYAEDGRPYGPRFPRLTTRDQVNAEVLLADYLGIDSFHLVIGASLGGHRALEWAVTYPNRVKNLAVIASSAFTTADQIALAHMQVLAIRNDPNFHEGNYYDQPAGQGPWQGLALARRIAHFTYRTAGEFNTRFGRDLQDDEDPLRGGRFAVQSYLDHKGLTLARRFDANSYITITQAMLSHDVGRGRGGIAAALARIIAPTLVLAIDTDRLFLLDDVRHMAEQIPYAGELAVLHSPIGHDAFLTQPDEVGHHLRRLLDSSERSTVSCA